MARAKKLLFLHRQPPLAGSRARELLEAALIAAAFEQDVTLVFADDGVFQLVGGVAELEAPLRELTGLDLDQVWAEREALAERGLAEHPLAVAARIADRARIAGLIAEADLVYTA